jgi:hypothetical protein
MGITSTANSPGVDDACCAVFPGCVSVRVGFLRGIGITSTVDPPVANCALFSCLPAFLRIGWPREAVSCPDIAISYVGTCFMCLVWNSYQNCIDLKGCSRGILRFRAWKRIGPIK